MRGSLKVLVLAVLILSVVLSSSVVVLARGQYRGGRGGSSGSAQGRGAQGSSQRANQTQRVEQRQQQRVQQRLQICKKMMPNAQTYQEGQVFMNQRAYRYYLGLDKNGNPVGMAVEVTAKVDGRYKQLMIGVDNNGKILDIQAVSGQLSQEALQVMNRYRNRYVNQVRCGSGESVCQALAEASAVYQKVQAQLRAQKRVQTQRQARTQNSEQSTSQSEG